MVLTRINSMYRVHMWINAGVLSGLKRHCNRIVWSFKICSFVLRLIITLPRAKKEMVAYFQIRSLPQIITKCFQSKQISWGICKTGTKVSLRTLYFPSHFCILIPIGTYFWLNSILTEMYVVRYILSKHRIYFQFWWLGTIGCSLEIYPRKLDHYNGIRGYITWT